MSNREDSELIAEIYMNNPTRKQRQKDAKAIVEREF